MTYLKIYRVDDIYTMKNVITGSVGGSGVFMRFKGNTPLIETRTLALWRRVTDTIFDGFGIRIAGVGNIYNSEASGSHGNRVVIRSIGTLRPLNSINYTYRGKFDRSEILEVIKMLILEPLMLFVDSSDLGMLWEFLEREMEVDLVGRK